MKKSWRTFLLLLAFSFVWFVLAGSDPTSWIIGIPAVLLVPAEIKRTGRQ